MLREDADLAIVADEEPVALRIERGELPEARKLLLVQLDVQLCVERLRVVLRRSVIKKRHTSVIYHLPSKGLSYRIVSSCTTKVPSAIPPHPSTGAISCCTLPNAAFGDADRRKAMTGAEHLMAVTTLRNIRLQASRRPVGNARATAHRIR